MKNTQITYCTQNISTCSFQQLIPFKSLNIKLFITFNCILFYVVISVTTNFIIQKLLFLSLCVVRLCFMKRSSHKTLRYNVCKSNFNLNEQSEEKIISFHCKTIYSILDLIIFYKSV